MRTWKLVLVGLGHVGKGMCRLLAQQAQQLEGDHGARFVLTAVTDLTAGTILNSAGIDPARVLQSADAPGERIGEVGDSLDVIGAADADILLEVTPTVPGTGEPAASYCRAAMQRGMHVVTTNKGPPALHHHEMAALATAHQVRFLFEGAVMSGSPVLSLFRNGLAGARVRAVTGILNGTTNYLITEMEAGAAFDAALARAQELGYAEANPSADIDGHDSAAKLAILASVAFGQALSPADVERQPLSDIDAGQVSAAAAEGRPWRYVASLRDGTATVGPRQLDAGHPLVGVRGVTNAVTIETDALGEVTVVGPGAGPKETAFALLADLLEIHHTAA